MMRVTSCSASHTSCMNVLGGFGGIVLDPNTSRLHQSGISIIINVGPISDEYCYWVNRPVLEVAAVAGEARADAGVELAGDLRAAAEPLDLLHALQPAVLHQLPQLLEGHPVPAAPNQSEISIQLARDQSAISISWKRTFHSVTLARKFSCSHKWPGV